MNAAGRPITRRLTVWWLAGLALAGLWLVAGTVTAHETSSEGCPSGGLVSFADVAADHFAAADISCLSGLGIIRGTGPDTFSPGQPVTRAQAAALLARTWRGQGQVCPGGREAFADVATDHFARADIGCLHALGIIRGTGPDTFSPDSPVTRAQVAALLARMWQAPGRVCHTASGAFRDVPADHFAHGDIGCLYALGIIRGTGRGVFSPDAPVTRAQAAALLARFLRSAAATVGTGAADTAGGPDIGGGGGGGSAPPARRVPAAPVFSVDTGEYHLYLTWTAPDGRGSPINGYRMRYRKLPANGWTLDSVFYLSAATNRWLSGFGGSLFTVGEEWALQVRAESAAGPGPWSNEVSATVGSPARPAAPGPAVGDASLRVSWTPPADNRAAITSYRVRYRATGATSWTTLTHTGLINGLTIVSLTNGTEYQVGVRAVNSRGAGPWSRSSRATPRRSTAPGVPTGLTLVPGSGKLSVSWTAPASNGNPLGGYQVEHRPTGGVWEDLAHTGLGASATITGLTDAAEYQVRVRAVNTQVQPNTSSAWTPVAAATPGTPPAASTPLAPTGLGLTVSTGQIVASWTPPTFSGPAVTGYNLRYKEAGTSAWTALAGPVTTTTATITGLTAGATYEVQVNAANQNGAGAWSAAVSASLPAPPSAPVRATLTLGNQQIAAAWTAPAANHSPITGYNVRYRPTGGTWEDHSHSGLTAGATITGLTNDIQYEVQVNAANSLGTGPWSPSAKTTPQAAVPNCAPRKPDAPIIRPAGLHWTVIYEHPLYGCATRLSATHMRHKAAGVSTWTNTQMGTRRSPDQVKIETGLSWGVEYEVQVRASSSYGGGPWSAVSTATPTAAYSLAETGVSDRDQTWTVYLCGGGEWTRHGDLDTAEEYAALLNSKLTPRLSEITEGEYEPTFVAATGDMPTGKHTGGYSLYYACKAESGQHIVVGHHAGIGYAGAAVICPPTGWMYAFVNPSVNRYREESALEASGHEIGHTLGWHHYRSSLDPWEFMHAGFYNDPYDRGTKSQWCGADSATRPPGDPPIPEPRIVHENSRP